ncbi:MAG: hypothetical protein [Siphoviridae sp. ctjeG17]|nr:MAG: hypothetical protein [Siphoviridae sp. ctjeG17]
MFIPHVLACCAFVLDIFCVSSKFTHIYTISKQLFYIIVYKK